MPQFAKRLMIVDGNAILHRAWHALPPLTTKEGLVVTGAYGFAMLLLRAIAELAPTHIAVTFDLAGPTFRHDAFDTYKAHREKKPDELYAQIPLIERILEAMRIPVYTAKGFEADDVIGTLACQAKKHKGMESVIVTGDLDTLQLVDDRTKVFTLRKGMTDTVLYDAEDVVAKMGVTPEQVADYKALRGDPSDNIPGVKGIGEKTAAELLGTFGSVKGIYEALENDDEKAASLSAGLRAKLIEGKKDALLAQSLTRIHCEAPVTLDEEKTAYVPAVRSQMKAIFEELQFSRLLQQVPEGAQQELVPTAAAKVVDALEGAETPVLASAEAALVFLAEAKKAKELAFRTAVEQPDAAYPVVVGLGVALPKTKAILAPDALSDRRVQQELSALLASAARKVCHDLKNEYTALATIGIGVEAPVFDLMLASYLLYAGERRHGLDAILAMECTVTVPAEAKNGAEALDALRQQLPFLLPAAESLQKTLQECGGQKVHDEIEAPLAAVISRMERCGIAIDEPFFAKFSIDLEKRIDSLRAEMHRTAGREFNVNSPAQLKEVLFDTLKLSAQGMKKTAKNGAISTAASELEKLRGSHPIIEQILAYREAAKLKSTYVDAIPALKSPRDGRVHARFNQTVAATGRLSSSDPNLQNIPTPETEYGRRVRNGFVAGKGNVLISADYSQFELRIAAHLAQEKSMIEAFKKGEDIHHRTSAAMFGEEEAARMRRVAKTINFGILYGMGPHRLAESAGISVQEARQYIEQYFAFLPGIQKYMEETVSQMKKKGYVETLFGRRRYFRNYHLLGKREQAEAERQAINMPIQGTQADIVKLAMLEVDAFLRKTYGEGAQAPVRMLLQVHDELIFEAKKELADDVVAKVVPIMEKAWKLDVPIVVNAAVGPRWGDMEKIA